MDSGDLLETLYAELLRDTHGYVRGIEPHRPTLIDAPAPGWQRLLRKGRERSRDTLERVAWRAGFSHRHFDPVDAGRRLARLTELNEGLREIYGRLGDDPSRQAMRDLLKFRVLGAPHGRLAITPAEFRAEQARVDRDHRVQAGTWTVSDPWFSPLSLYQIPVRDGRFIRLHAHSVDVVSVFVYGQYSYSRGSASIRVQPGDVVLDVGGCWGDTALYFADLVGSEGAVYTFEVDPESLEVLKANLALNPELAERIHVVEQALWDKPGRTLVFDPAGRCTAVRDRAAEPGAKQVQTTTVDEFVGEEGLDRIDFIKMDVEGAELNVILGAQASLVRCAPKLAVAAYHQDDDLVRIPRAINASGVDYVFFLATASPIEEETVLFARGHRPE